jgi:hypothetical protein
MVELVRSWTRLEILPVRDRDCYNEADASTARCRGTGPDWAVTKSDRRSDAISSLSEVVDIEHGDRREACEWIEGRLRLSRMLLVHLEGMQSP